MKLKKDTCCSYCGHGFDVVDYPKLCNECGNTTFKPVPACVICIPVLFGTERGKLPQEHRGTVLVRRSIEPGFGELALAGGYMDTGETWEETAVREFEEEVGYRTNPDFWKFEWIDYGEHGEHLLIFCSYDFWDYNGNHPLGRAIRNFRPNDEVSELVVAHDGQEAPKLAFPSHQKAMEWAFTL